MMADIGPGREQYDLAPEEADMFTMIVEYNTRAPERFQLSNVFRGIRRPVGQSVIDSFHRNARKMWRTNL